MNGFFYPEAMYRLDAPLLTRIEGNPGRVQTTDLPSDAWGRAVPFALLEQPAAGIRRLMVGPLRCGACWPADHELSMLLLTTHGELIRLDLPVRHLNELRHRATLQGPPAPCSEDEPADEKPSDEQPSDEETSDDELASALEAPTDLGSPLQDWKDAASWGVPEGYDPGAGMLGSWYRLLRRRSRAHGQPELTPEAFMQSLRHRIEQGVEWVIDGLPSAAAQAVRMRGMHAPLAQRLLELAEAHPHPQAVRFAEQALRTLPLGLLEALVRSEPGWREALLSGRSLGRLLAGEGIAPAVYRLMLRDPGGKESGMSDGLFGSAQWRLACRALAEIDPSEWPRSLRDQRVFAHLVRRIEWGVEHGVDHHMVAWAWAPRVPSATRCVHLVSQTAYRLLCMQGRQVRDEAKMAAFIHAIMQRLPPITGLPRAQRKHWLRRLKQRLGSQSMLRQLWRDVQGSESVPAADQALALASAMPERVELPGLGWFRVQVSEQAIKALGVQAGNCLQREDERLYYLSAGHVIGRVEEEGGGLLGVLAINVRNALSGLPDDEVCEWQAVAGKGAWRSAGLEGEGLGQAMRLAVQVARRLGTFGRGQ